MRDLALLLGCFAKFRSVVILQTTPENFQDFGGRFAGGTNNKDAPEVLLVRAITLGESYLYIVVRSSDFVLFFA
jgi:hypothetical protein